MAPSIEVLPISHEPSTPWALNGLRRLYNAKTPEDQVLRSSKQDESEEVFRPTTAYIPDRDEYEARVKRLEKDLKPGTKLPDGFIKKINGPRVWSAESIRNPDMFRVQLGENEVEEIENALQYFKVKFLIVNDDKKTQLHSNNRMFR